MKFEENNDQYKILAKYNNSNKYEIIMSLQEKKNLINLIIEPDESQECQ